MNRKSRIAVIGAGLGGLTVAGFLQRAGFPVKVYEQAPAFSRIGAGIILSANVCKVLRRLGVEDDLVEAGIKSRMLRQPRLGHRRRRCTKSIFDAGSEQRYGGPYVHIHRGDLHDVLAQVVTPGTIAFNHQLVDLPKIRDAAIGSASQNGDTGEADIVIGADGIRSKVREFLLGSQPPRFVGAVAHRAIFRSERLHGLQDPGLHQMVGHRTATPALFHDR